MPLVCLVLTLHIAVTQREFDCSLVRLLATELCDTFLDSGIYRSVDGIDGSFVILRNKNRCRVSLSTAVDGSRLPTVKIGKSRVDTCDNLSLTIYISHFTFPPT